jgi:hypothetical protein
MNETNGSRIAKKICNVLEQEGTTFEEAMNVLISILLSSAEHMDVSKIDFAKMCAEMMSMYEGQNRENSF